MWGTLRHVAVGKGVVVTTRASTVSFSRIPDVALPPDSIEEASVLANRVAVLSKKMPGRFAVVAFPRLYHAVHPTTKDLVARCARSSSLVVSDLGRRDARPSAHGSRPGRTSRRRRRHAVRGADPPPTGPV